MSYLPTSALERYRTQQRLTVATVAGARRVWDQMDGNFDSAWRVLGPRIAVLVAAGQLAVAQDAAASMAATIAELGLPQEFAGPVDAASVAGTASDGRDLEGLLYGSVVTAREAAAAGAGTDAALGQGRSALDMWVRTMIVDAGREAASAALASHYRVDGYVRMLNPPSCSRCAVQAGRFFRYNRGFQRHPNCDCVHMPSSEDIAGDLRTDPAAAVRAGQVTGLSKAQTAAILDGADTSQVINASRGMRTASIGGRDVKITLEGTTKRGYATYVRRELDRQRGEVTSFERYAGGQQGANANYARRRTRMPRLTVDEIYRIGENRGDTLRLLAANGYILPKPGQSIADVARATA